MRSISGWATILNLLAGGHLWGPRGYYKAPFYTNVNAHFVSEIGYHGCPDRTSLEKMFDPDFVISMDQLTESGMTNGRQKQSGLIPNPPSWINAMI